MEGAISNVTMGTKGERDHNISESSLDNKNTQNVRGEGDKKYQHMVNGYDSDGNDPLEGNIIDPKLTNYDTAHLEPLCDIEDLITTPVPPLFRGNVIIDHEMTLNIT